MEQPTRTAVHEAGHAAAAVVLGVPIRYVTIVPDDRFAGMCRIVAGARSPLAQVILELSGPAAVYVAGGEPDVGALDRQRAWYAAWRGCGDVYRAVNLYDEGRGVAEALVRRYAIPVLYLAGELLRRRTMDGPAVERFLRAKGVRTIHC